MMAEKYGKAAGRGVPAAAAPRRNIRDAPFLRPQHPGFTQAPAAAAPRLNTGFQKGGKGKDKSRKNDTAKSVWNRILISNIPEGATSKELLELGKQFGDCRFAKVFEGQVNGKGNGISAMMVFDSADEARGAINALSGAMIGDNAIEANVW